MKQNVIYIKYLREVETEELDLELYNPFFTDEEMENDYPSFIYENHDVGGWSEEDPIKIEDLQNLLEEIKNSGASHVEIMHHTDHHSYVLTPSIIRKATEEEIKENEERKKGGIKKRKMEHIENMKNEIKRLEEEVLTKK
jgi:hypothetical protein